MKGVLVDLLTFLHSAFLSQPQPHSVEKFVEFSQQKLREHVAEAEPIVLKNGMKISVVTNPRPSAALREAAPVARQASGGPISFVGAPVCAGVSNLVGGGGFSEPASVFKNADVFPKAPEEQAKK